MTTLIAHIGQALLMAFGMAWQVGWSLLMDVAFGLLGWIPRRRPDMHAAMTHFSLNYTAWLDISFGLLALALFVLARRNPMQHGHCEHHAHAAPAQPHHS